MTDLPHERSATDLQNQSAPPEPGDVPGDVPGDRPDPGLLPADDGTSATATGRAELLPETRRALLHALAKAQVNGRAPSTVAAVVRDGRAQWFATRGEVAGAAPGPDTQYRIGSLTKTFVAVLVLRLREEGLLALDDRLDTHLPEAPEAGDATVAQLLSHSSGLAAEASGPWWERTPGELRPDLPDVFGEKPRPHRPGRLFHYSNPGFALLGALVEKVRGDGWFAVLRREVLEPLGMTGTTPLPRAPHAEGWAVHPYADVVLPEPAADTGLMAPAGQLWSTAADLCRFAAFLTDGDPRVLGAETLAEMRRPAAAPASGDWRAGYGLGMQLDTVDGRALSGHTGSMPGFVAALWTSPADGLATVVLANATSGLRVGGVAAELLGLVAAREPALPAPWRPDPDADHALLELCGTWHWGAAPTQLLLGPGRTLTLGMPGAGRNSAFRPEPDGTWTGLDGYLAGERLRVVRHEDGSVSHLDVGTFVYTREPYGPAAPVPGGVDPDGWR
ncbi:serine hydrolase [Streptomyces sp. SM14]|uniref:serine hydrolase domain-containing protein n=1 Tax=Streptomyces sp. SM14 TaxID=1736045 RepID=UPI000CD4F2CF|nr:serine hydrolase domain-containing protein [Streptomyces sp. SM14]